MAAVEPASGAHAPEEAQKPVALVVTSYVAAVMVPFIGLLFALVVLSRPGRWARRQGVLIIVLCGLLVTFGVALLPMITDSYFAAKANHELRVVANETQRAEEESRRQFHAEMAKLHKEEAATDARIRQFREHGGH